MQHPEAPHSSSIWVYAQTVKSYPLPLLRASRVVVRPRFCLGLPHLESLPFPADEISMNWFIRHSVNLKLWLMEGSYSKVWNAQEEAPAGEYKFFVDNLMGTIR